MNIVSLKKLVDDLVQCKEDTTKDNIAFKEAEGDGLALMKASENRFADKQFSICHTELLNGSMMFIGGPTPTHRITLDTEDIEYFINKYSEVLANMANTEAQYQKELKDLNKKYRR